jgi:hypothetical protein
VLLTVNIIDITGNSDSSAPFNNKDDGSEIYAIIKAHILCISGPNSISQSIC